MIPTTFVLLSDATGRGRTRSGSGPAAITANYRQYGPLGIVLMRLTWRVVVSVIMLGGPVFGAALHEHRMQSMTAEAASDESELANHDAVTAQHVPAPRAQDATALEPPPNL